MDGHRYGIQVGLVERIMVYGWLIGFGAQFWKMKDGLRSYF